MVKIGTDFWVQMVKQMDKRINLYEVFKHLLQKKYRGINLDKRKNLCKLLF